MNKYLLVLILPLLSFIMVGCDNDDVIATDLTLFAGTWKVIDNGDQYVFETD